MMVKTTRMVNAVGKLSFFFLFVFFYYGPASGVDGSGLGRHTCTPLSWSSGLSSGIALSQLPRSAGSVRLIASELAPVLSGCTHTSLPGLGIYQQSESWV